MALGMRNDNYRKTRANSMQIQKITWVECHIFLFLTYRREAPFICSGNVETPSIVTPSLSTSTRSASTTSTPNLSTKTASTQGVDTQIMSANNMHTQIVSTPSVSMQILSTPSVTMQNVNQYTNYAGINTFQIAILLVSVFVCTVVTV